MPDKITRREFIKEMVKKVTAVKAAELALTGMATTTGCGSEAFNIPETQQARESFPRDQICITPDIAETLTPEKIEALKEIISDKFLQFEPYLWNDRIRKVTLARKSDQYVDGEIFISASLHTNGETAVFVKLEEDIAIGIGHNSYSNLNPLDKAALDTFGGDSSKKNFAFFAGMYILNRDLFHLIPEVLRNRNLIGLAEDFESYATTLKNDVFNKQEYDVLLPEMELDYSRSIGSRFKQQEINLEELRDIKENVDPKTQVYIKFITLYSEHFPYNALWPKAPYEWQNTYGNQDRIDEVDQYHDELLEKLQTLLLDAENSQRVDLQRSTRKLIAVTKLSKYDFTRTQMDAEQRNPNIYTTKTSNPQELENIARELAPELQKNAEQAIDIEDKIYLYEEAMRVYRASNNPEQLCAIFTLLTPIYSVLGSRIYSNNSYAEICSTK